MDKFYLRLADEDQYSDHYLGRLITKMIKDNYDDLILFFRDYIITVVFNKKTFKYDLTLSKNISKQYDEKHFILAEKMKTMDVECHKWMAHYFMSLFRDCYPELKSCDFPVTEYQLWFSDADYVLLKGEHFMEVDNDWDFIYDEDD